MRGVGGGEEGKRPKEGAGGVGGGSDGLVVGGGGRWSTGVRRGGCGGQGEGWVGGWGGGGWRWRASGVMQFAVRGRRSAPSCRLTANCCPIKRSGGPA